MLQEGLEPPTLGLLDPCSTKLSYQSRCVPTLGIEPRTFRSSVWRSPNWARILITMMVNYNWGCTATEDTSDEKRRNLKWGYLSLNKERLLVQCFSVQAFISKIVYSFWNLVFTNPHSLKSKLRVLVASLKGADAGTCLVNSHQKL